MRRDHRLAADHGSSTSDWRADHDNATYRLIVSENGLCPAHGHAMRRDHRSAADHGSSTSDWRADHISATYRLIARAPCAPYTWDVFSG